MRRTELFEIHDHRWCPTSLRDMVTDGLQALWGHVHSYKPIFPLLRDALTATGTSEVLDLCSGGGGPWFRLIHDFESEQHVPIRVCLTDKYPNRMAFEGALAMSDAKIVFHTRPVEATEVPADLNGFRTMFSSFHHFGAGEARKVLANAVEHGRGIAIFETPMRRARTMLAICMIPVLILFLTPRIRPFRWSRMLWTYVFPVVPFVLWFDGWMSCLRSYSHKELHELVHSLPQRGYLWEVGTQSDGLLPVTYLIGHPVNSAQLAV